ncbi:MAG: preprotein translocase subunit SecA [Patescibacteria group bacterium]|nr:preprotein translocase subunit SecA [Patescibacteria group bacterium]
MAGFLGVFGREAKPPRELVLINEEEERLRSLGDEEIKAESLRLKKEVADGKGLDEILPLAFALAREASRRTLGQRHYDVQLWGGLILHHGGIAEMVTGEGKTLAATPAVYLNALEGRGVHVITVNDYLAQRDAVWMGQIYNFLGLSVACLAHEAAFIYDPAWRIPPEEGQLIDKERDTTGSFLVQKEYLRPISRREAYEADITYGTNHEFGFDYLRDNLASSVIQQVQRGHNFAVIDEVDSILIDEARTPLIISAPDAESSELYKVFARAIEGLEKDQDYTVDEKMKSVEITESGIDKVERTTGIKDIFGAENLRLVRYLESSLKAKSLFTKDKDYVVKDGEVIIVDQFTGRLMFGRRYSAGLHQAIEAKEKVLVQQESRTYAQITIQNYFRLYKKLAGMTGTAQTSAEEFHKVYGLEVASIPTNKPLVRKDESDTVFKNLKGKYRAIAKEVRRLHEEGRPVLIGTTSIEKNEMLAGVLQEEGVPFEILNAKNHEQEGRIIAQAGRLGAVTLATNLAGRGVDIVLGGNPPDKEEAARVRELGGLHVLGTERHEARRIDNQLRGRAGRQGDPGSSQFFLSLEDDLLRIFGGEKLKALMERMDVPDDMPIQSGLVSRAIIQAQEKIEGLNFDARKYLLEYDDILNKQRMEFYLLRQKLVAAMSKEDLKGFIKDAISRHIGVLKNSTLAWGDVLKMARDAGVFSGEAAEGDFAALNSEAEIKIDAVEDVGFANIQLLGAMDFLWMNHLEDIEALTESVKLRAYGQRDPLVEYRRESRALFDNMKRNSDAWAFNNAMKILAAPAIPAEQRTLSNIQNDPRFAGVGRNDPCPCGSGKKFKRCGLLNTPEHQENMKRKTTQQQRIGG